MARRFGTYVNRDFYVPLHEHRKLQQEAERLRIALRYWLPDETMIPAGHEIAWNEHVELIPEHRHQRQTEKHEG